MRAISFSSYTVSVKLFLLRYRQQSGLRRSPARRSFHFFLGRLRWPLRLRQWHVPLGFPKRDIFANLTQSPVGRFKLGRFRLGCCHFRLQKKTQGKERVLRPSSDFVYIVRKTESVYRLALASNCGLDISIISDDCNVTVERLFASTNLTAPLSVRS